MVHRGHKQTKKERQLSVIKCNDANSMTSLDQISHYFVLLPSSPTAPTKKKQLLQQEYAQNDKWLSFILSLTLQRFLVLPPSSIIFLLLCLVCFERVCVCVWCNKFYALVVYVQSRAEVLYNLYLSTRAPCSRLFILYQHVLPAVCACVMYQSPS